MANISLSDIKIQFLNQCFLANKILGHPSFKFLSRSKSVQRA